MNAQRYGFSQEIGYLERGNWVGSGIVVVVVDVVVVVTVTTITTTTHPLFPAFVMPPVTQKAKRLAQPVDLHDVVQDFFEIDV